MEAELSYESGRIEQEERIRSQVLASLCEQPPGAALVANLEKLVGQHGGLACEVILQLIMHRNFSAEEAVTYWQEMIAHHQSLSRLLSRDVALSTALCDYFATHGKGGSFPKIIDVHEFETINNEINFDFLTGLSSRRALEKAFEKEIVRAARYKHTLSVLFFDVDHFKEINDSYGHQAGDDALQMVAKILVKNKRATDVAARYGGDEFVMLLPDTNKTAAQNLAERIRLEINHKAMAFNDVEIKLAVSGGIAAFPEDADSAPELFRCADQALYQAKRQGKNITALYNQEKRRTKRLELTTPLTISKIDSDSLKLVAAQSKNLSRTGILLESSTAIELGSLVELEVTIDDTKVTLHGQVVRTEKVASDNFDIGVSFLAPRQMAHIMLRELAGQ